ncbi:MAG: HAD hydrolase-like protein [Desulfamplus sp.]|nr:HAD hydrolase-like protein [Desulfamplus sp.]
MTSSHLPKIKVKNLKQIRKYLQKNLGMVDVVSFDIFDTLLIRRLDPPEIIHESVAKQLKKYYQSLYRHNVSWEELLNIRYSVEAELRQQATNQGFDHECRFKEIIQKWVNRLAIGENNDQIAAFLHHLELSMEKAALHPNLGAEDLLCWLKGKNKKVIVVSDMYLSSDDLYDILKVKGMKQYIDKIFVSSDKLICKYSGRLYKDVCETLNCRLDRMIHIGDNEISDFKIPLSMNIRSLHLKIPGEEKRKLYSKTCYEFGKTRPYWRGKHLLEVARSFRHTDPDPSWYRRYGYANLAPIFCAYITGIVERVRELDIDHLFFLARDGYLLQKIFIQFQKKLLNSDISTINSTYAYLTRKTTAAASIAEGMSYSQAVVGLYNPKQKGLYSILKTYSLPVNEFIGIAAKHGFKEIDAPIYDWNDERLLSFLADNNVQNRIINHATAHRNILQQYLSQIGYFDYNKIALIDIGWNGSIQYYISKAFKNVPNIVLPETWGLYFGYVNGIPYGFSNKDHIEGVMFDARDQHANNKLCDHFEEVFEESTRSTDATVTGYKYTNDHAHVLPVFKRSVKPDRKAEINSNPSIIEMQEGILEFTGQFIDALNITAYTAGDIKPFIETITERIIVYPKRKEVEMLTRLSHSEDFGGDNIMNLNDIKYSRQHLLKLPFIKGDLDKSDWKYGSYVSMWMRFFLPLIRLFDLKRS